MLFDYEKYIKQSPYYSNIENTPEYKAFQKRQEERQKAATIGGAISSIFTAGLNFIPGVGPALSAGMGAVSGAAQKGAAAAGNKQASKELNKIQQDFNAQLPEGVNAQTGAQAPKVDTGDGDMPNNFEKFLKLLQNPNLFKKKTRTGVVSQQYASEPIEFTGSLTPDSTQNMDWSTGGFDITDGLGVTEGFANGGIMNTKGANMLPEVVIEPDYKGPRYFGYRNPSKDSQIENFIEYIPGIGNILSVNDWQESVNSLYNNPNYETARDFALETLGQIPMAKFIGSTAKEIKQGLKILDFITNASTDENVKKGINKGNDLEKKMGFAKGGVMDTDEAPVLVTGGAPGTDTVALVDARSGKDTGLRLDNGEMVVVSADNVQALQEAVASGDMFSVFSIVQDQLKQKPENGRMAEGNGSFNIEAERKRTAAGLAAAQKDKDRAADDAFRTKHRIQAQKLMDDLKSLDEQEGREVGYAPGSMTPGAGTGAVSVVGKEPDLEVGVTSSTNPEYWKKRQKLIEAIDINLKYDQYGMGYKPGSTPAPKAAPKVAPKRPQQDIGQMTMEEAQTIQGFPLPQATLGQVAIPDVPDLAQMESKSDLRNELLANDFRRFIGKAKEKAPALQDLAGYGYDIGRFITGMQAAGEELPAFSKSARFEDFMNRLEQQSYMGLTAPEMTSLQRGADRAMAYDVANIYNLAGGNTGAALGNLGRAAAGRYGQDLRIAAMDRAARQQNLQFYGSYLPMDVNLDRTIFSDAYSNALRNKQAGAQMAAAGLQNAMERGITNRFYGPGSQNELLKQEQLAYLQDMRGVAKAQAEFWQNPANYSKYATGLFTPGTPEAAAAAAAAATTTTTTK